MPDNSEIYINRKREKMTYDKIMEIAPQFCQKTLLNPINFTGIGVHSGKMARVVMKPAAVNTGIVFKRVDVTGKNNEIRAVYDNVVDTKLCTCLGNGEDMNVSTIEHLMATFHAYGISNAIVEIDSYELPILDGSAKQFAFLIESAGIKKQNAPLKALRIMKTVAIDEGKAFASLEPAENGLVIDYEIEFPSKAIGKQNVTFDVYNGNFKRDIAGARTFGFRHEIEYLKSIGLCRGGSLENALVIDGDTILNHDGLRYENEFVRHKTLDAVGDLYTSGYVIIGKYTGIKAGHGITNVLLRSLFSDASNYEIVDLNKVLFSVTKKRQEAVNF